MRIGLDATCPSKHTPPHESDEHEAPRPGRGGPLRGQQHPGHSPHDGRGQGYGAQAPWWTSAPRAGTTSARRWSTSVRAPSVRRDLELLLREGQERARGDAAEAVDHQAETATRRAWSDRSGRGPRSTRTRSSFQASTSAPATPGAPGTSCRIWRAGSAIAYSSPTDGHHAYLSAVGLSFGTEIDYAMLVKLYGTEPAGEARYSPPKCIGTRMEVKQGDPDPEHVSTSYAERQNLNMRMGCGASRGSPTGSQEAREPRAHDRALLCVSTLRSRPSTRRPPPAVVWGRGASSVERIVERDHVLVVLALL